LTAIELYYLEYERRGLVENEGLFLGVAENAVDKARKLGAQLAEAYISSTKELNIDVREARVETMKLAEERGLGLRVVRGGRTGFSFSTDLSPQGIEEVSRQALANCEKTAEDPYNTLPAPSRVYPDLDIFDPAIREATVEQKIEMARRMEGVCESLRPQSESIEIHYQDGSRWSLSSQPRPLSGFLRAYCGIYLPWRRGGEKARPVLQGLQPEISASSGRT
jgi:PmbA protein